MTDCMPGPCRCCVCQGKHCLMWHPGHSCSMPLSRRSWIEEMLNHGKTPQPLKDPKKDVDGES